jgi:hypothetical protein
MLAVFACIDWIGHGMEFTILVSQFQQEPLPGFGFHLNYGFAQLRTRPAFCHPASADQAGSQIAYAIFS